MDFNEDFLCDVISVIMIDHHFARKPIDLLLVGTHQHVEPVVPRLRVSDFG